MIMNKRKGPKVDDPLNRGEVYQTTYDDWWWWYGQYMIDDIINNVIVKDGITVVWQEL
jgi:hypothetical protein